MCIPGARNRSSNDQNVGAGVPNLRRVLRVPPEGEDVLAHVERLGHLHQVLEAPALFRDEVRGGRQRDLGPLGTLRIGPLGSPESMEDIFMARTTFIEFQFYHTKGTVKGSAFVSRQLGWHM